VRAVRSIENRAFRKLRNHPILRQLWSEFESVSASASVPEPDPLTGEELAALFGLVQTPIERQALLKVLVAMLGLWAVGLPSNVPVIYELNRPPSGGLMPGLGFCR